MSGRRLLAVVTAVVVLMAGCGEKCCLSGPGPDMSERGRPPYGTGTKVGRTYDYSLSTHCGIEWTVLDGTWWRATPPLSDGSGNPPPDWENPFQGGHVRLLDHDTAEFRAGQLRARFRRTAAASPPFSCA